MNHKRIEIPTEIWYNKFTTTKNTNSEEFLMNIITQEARKRQAVVKLANKKGKSFASRIYGVSLSSVKRWCKRYDGTWQSLRERSHRPHSNSKRHTEAEEQLILKCFQRKYLRYGWDGVYDEAVKNGYTRSFSGMVYAAKRMGLGGKNSNKPCMI